MDALKVYPLKLRVKYKSGSVKSFIRIKFE